MKTSKRSLMSLAVAVGLALVVNGGGVVHAQRQALPAGPSNLPGHSSIKLWDNLH
jgi:hypothetical protein